MALTFRILDCLMGGAMVDRTISCDSSSPVRRLFPSFG